MLKQRVITALVLLAILLPALLHPNTLGFNAIVLVMVSAGAWEWGRLNLVGPVATWASVAGVAAVAGLAWQQGWLAASYPLLWWAKPIKDFFSLPVCKHWKAVCFWREAK